MGDSKTAINCTKNEHTKSNVYMLLQTNKIRKLTKPADWRHVPAKLNVSDFTMRYTVFNKLTST